MWGDRCRSLLSTLICEDLLTNPDGALSLYRAVFKRQISAVFPAQLRCLYVVTIWLSQDDVAKKWISAC